MSVRICEIRENENGWLNKLIKHSRCGRCVEVFVNVLFGYAPLSGHCLCAETTGETRGEIIKFTYFGELNKKKILHNIGLVDLRLSTLGKFR